MASAASSSYFQGGDYVELLSAQGKAPASTWKLQGKIIKSFDKAIKGNAFQMDGSSETKMQLPKAPTPSSSSLGLTQRFLVFQLSVPHTRSFSIEIGFSDFQKIRRRLVFASAFRETTMTALHVQIPISTSISRDQWMSFVFDLQALTEHYFPGSSFRSMESICISGSCRLKRIFTMKDAPFCATVAQESQARMAAFKQQRLQCKDSTNVPTAVAGFAEMKDIPKQFLFSVGTSSLPIPTEYFLPVSSAPVGATQAAPPPVARSAGVKPTTTEANAPAAPKPGASKPRTADNRVGSRPQATAKSSSTASSENESRARSAPFSRVSDRRTGRLSGDLHGCGHEASPRRSEPPSLKSIRATAAARDGTSGASNTLAEQRTRRADYADDEELDGDASDQEFNETSTREERGSSGDVSPAQSPVRQVAPLKPPHRSKTCFEASPSLATQRKTHRQTVIAEIQSKLDQLTKEAEEEEERDRETFVKSVSIGNGSARESPIADRQSAKRLTTSKSLPTNTHEPPNPWPENELLRSPEPMVLRRMQATKKPEILFSSSIFNFDREAPTFPASDETVTHSSKSRQLFDWDSLLEDPEGSLSMSTKLPTTRQSVESPTALSVHDRATTKPAPMRDVRENPNENKESVDSEANNEAADDRLVKIMEAKRQVRAEKELYESRNKQYVDQTEDCLPDGDAEFNYSTSPGTGGLVHRSRDLRESSSSHEPTRADSPRSPARSEADSDGDLSIDLTDNLGEIDPTDAERQPQEQQAASPSSATSEDEDSFNFDELVVRDRDFQPQKASHPSPEKPQRLNRSTDQTPITSSTRPRSSEPSRPTNGAGHRAPELLVDNKQERYTGQAPQASSTSSPVKRSNREQSPKPDDSRSSAHLMSCSQRRLASLLESTDWSQLPLSSIVSSKAPLPTRKPRKLSADPPRSKNTQAGGTASSSLELIYDPILRCYFDPIGKKYYTLAK